MLYYERKLKKQGYDLVVGIDEAGRGPLAGPVVAGAVILNTYRFKNRIDDSKKLSALARQMAFAEIIKKSIYGIGIVGEQEIDRINILNATRQAMQKALSELLKKIEGCLGRVHIIVDGNMLLNTPLACTAIIKGDGRSKSIASASILAKVTRDRIMDDYDKIYPLYGFIRHKGYPTEAHRKAIKRFGPCRIHRKTFYFE